MGHIRCELGSSLDIGGLQGYLMVHWRPYMGPLDIFLTDATCYETSMRHPTNAKLPWEGCEWVHRQMREVHKAR